MKLLLYCFQQFKFNPTDKSTWCLVSSCSLHLPENECLSSPTINFMVICPGENSSPLPKSLLLQMYPALWQVCSPVVFVQVLLSIHAFLDVLFSTGILVCYWICLEIIEISRKNCGSKKLISSLIATKIFTIISIFLTLSPLFKWIHSVWNIFRPFCDQ